MKQEQLYRVALKNKKTNQAGSFIIFQASLRTAWREFLKCQFNHVELKSIRKYVMPFQYLKRMQAQFSLMFSGEAIHLAKAVYVKMLNSTAKSIVYKRRVQRSCSTNTVSGYACINAPCLDVRSYPMHGVIKSNTILHNLCSSTKYKER